MKELLFELYLGWEVVDIGENMFNREGNTRTRDQWRKKANQIAAAFVKQVNPSMSEEERASGMSLN